MYKKIYLIIISLFTSLFCTSQTLLLKDAESLYPVADVAIFNYERTKSVLSNLKGEISLDIFSDNEIIYLQHPSYKKIQFAKSSLEAFTFYLDKEIIEIEEYVISAYRWEQNKKEIPNKILQLTHKEIIFNNPQTTADLLAYSNEVFVQKSQLGGGSPVIRGFSTNTVLLVIDGVRMNNAIYREGNLQNVISLDANGIESSEVIFGPGSVTYGSDALGGVMDFHTLQAKLSVSMDENTDISGNAFTRYSSANNEKTGHLDFNIASKKWAFLTSISFSDFDDLRMGSKNNPEYQRPQYVKQVNGIDSIYTNNKSNLQVKSGYNQINLMQKIRFCLSKDLDMTYAFHYSKLSDVPRYDRLIQYSGDDLKYGEWYYGPQLWMMHALNVNYSRANKLFDNSKLTLAFQDYEESRHDRRYRKNDLTETTEKVDAYSLNLDFDKNLKRENQIYYGIEAVYNSVSSTAQLKDILSGSISPEQTRYPDGINDYTTLAAYLSYKENFGKKFTALAGVRANYVSLYSTLEDTSFFDFPFNEILVHNSAVNGSVGFVYRPLDKWQFNLNFSSGFHAPNIDDMAKIFDPEPGTIIVPNENLNPEYAYNIDLGIKKDFFDIASISITGFYTYLTDAFVRRDFAFNGQDSIMYKGEMSKVLAIVNADKAYIYGFNASASIELPYNLNLKSVINFNRGEDQDGIPLRHATPLFGSTRLTYSKKVITASVFANYNGEIEYDDLAPSEQDKPYMYAQDENGNPFSPSWWTLNFMSSYDIKNFAKISMGVENILDNRYRPYASGIVAPGINLILGLRLKF